MAQDDIEGPVGIRDLLLSTNLEFDAVHSSRFGVLPRMLNHAFEWFDATDPPGPASDFVFTGFPAISAPEIKHVLVSEGCTQRKVRKQLEKVVEVISFEIGLRERSVIALRRKTLG
jgi:hypothetical protein